MNKICISEIKKYEDEMVEIQGFVDSIRNLQYVIFLVIRDNTDKIQVTIEKSDFKELVEKIENLTPESTVKISGKIVVNEKVKLNGVELIPSDIEITSLSLPELPIDIKNKDKSLRETRLDYRFLDLRREENHLLFKVATLLEHKMREFFINQDYFEIHSPKISGSSAESGSEVFKIDYFGQEACLSQSPQFYKQMAIASGFNKVFEIGPAFRAENSHTSYHATEINMADVEVAWIDSFEDIMDLQEAWLKYALNNVYEQYGEKIKETFKVDLVNTSVKIPRITFKEAKQIIKEHYNYVGQKIDDFERKEEEYLSQYAKEKYNSDFIFVTKFPYSARPFYHMLDKDGNTNSYDLIFRGLEITTGAQREHRVEKLINQIKEKDIELASLSFYVDFFRYGCPPHGGFGVGISRILMKMFEIDNIREATFVYRGPNRLNP